MFKGSAGEYQIRARERVEGARNYLWVEQSSSNALSHLPRTDGTVHKLPVVEGAKIRSKI